MSTPSRPTRSDVYRAGPEKVGDLLAEHLLGWVPGTATWTLERPLWCPTGSASCLFEVLRYMKRRGFRVHINDYIDHYAVSFEGPDLNRGMQMERIVRDPGFFPAICIAALVALGVVE